MMKRVLLLFSMAFAIGSLTGQEFTVDADFRTRLENGPNFGPAVSGEKVTTNIFNRARLNIMFKNEKFTLKFSPQDVRSWNATISAATPSQDNTFGIADAWLEYKIDENGSIKVGRQALDYDNNRLLGHLDWTMQGRFFEAAKYTRKFSENTKLDVVATYHNDEYNEAGTIDGGPTAKTKTMQLLHLTSKVSDQFKFTALILNNVVDDPADAINKTDNNFATFGFNPHLTLNDKASLYGSAYYQTGRGSGIAAVTDNPDTVANEAKASVPSKTINAYEVSLNFDYKVSPSASFTLGGEVLSGTDFDEAEENNSFAPLYGTNHALNGYMDYFYVPFNGQQGQFGLVDAYLKTQFKLSEKSTLKVHGHYFATAADTGGDSDLGTEIDLVFVRKIDKDFNLVVGHSQFFAGSLLDTPVNQDYQGWSWVQLNFKPNLFKTNL